jgi:hypothetical protein
MINTRIEIKGEMKKVWIFDSMFEYLATFGSNISGYTLHVISEDKYIVNGFKPSADSNFHVLDVYEYYGKSYTHVNWGELEICLIPSNQVDEELFTIYKIEGENTYHKYRSYLCRKQSYLFRTKCEAQKRVDGLNEYGN